MVIPLLLDAVTVKKLVLEILVPVQEIVPLELLMLYPAGRPEALKT